MRLFWMSLVGSVTLADGMQMKRYQANVSSCDVSTLTCDAEAILLESPIETLCPRISETSLSCTEADYVFVSCIGSDDAALSLTLTDTSCDTALIVEPGPDIAIGDLTARQALFALSILSEDVLASCEQAEVIPMLRISCDFVLDMEKIPDECERIGVDKINCPYSDQLPETMFFRCYDGDLEASVDLDDTVYYCNQHGDEGSYGGQVSTTLELYRLCDSVYESMDFSTASNVCSGQCAGDGCSGSSCRFSISSLDLLARGSLCPYGVGGAPLPVNSSALPFRDDKATGSPTISPTGPTAKPTNEPMPPVTVDNSSDYGLLVKRFDANMSSCEGASNLTCKGEALLVESDVGSLCRRSSDRELSCSNAKSVVVSCVTSQKEDRSLELTDSVCDSADVSDGVEISVVDVNATQALYAVKIENNRTDSCERALPVPLLRISCDFVIGMPDPQDACKQVKTNEINCVYSAELPEKIGFRCYGGNLSASANLEASFYDCGAIVDEEGSYGGNLTMKMSLLRWCGSEYESAGAETASKFCRGKCAGSGCEVESCRLLINKMGVNGTAGPLCTYGVGYRKIPLKDVSSVSRTVPPSNPQHSTTSSSRKISLLPLAALIVLAANSF